LFAEEPEQPKPPEPESEKQEIKSYTRNKPGRKPLDPNLRRVKEIIDIPEDEKTCACGEKMARIGEETSEKLEIIPQSVFVRKTMRPKYAGLKSDAVIAKAPRTKPSRQLSSPPRLPR